MNIYLPTNQYSSTRVHAFSPNLYSSRNHQQKESKTTKSFNRQNMLTRSKTKKIKSIELSNLQSSSTSYQQIIKRSIKSMNRSGFLSSRTVLQQQQGSMHLNNPGIRYQFPSNNDIPQNQINYKTANLKRKIKSNPLQINTRKHQKRNHLIRKIKQKNANTQKKQKPKTSKDAYFINVPKVVTHYTKPDYFPCESIVSNQTDPLNSMSKTVKTNRSLIKASSRNYRPNRITSISRGGSISSHPEPIDASIIKQDSSFNASFDVSFSLMHDLNVQKTPCVELFDDEDNIYLKLDNYSNRGVRSRLSENMGQDLKVSKNAQLSEPLFDLTREMKTGQMKIPVSKENRRLWKNECQNINAQPKILMNKKNMNKVNDIVSRQKESISFSEIQQEWDKCHQGSVKDYTDLVLSLNKDLIHLVRKYTGLKTQHTDCRSQLEGKQKQIADKREEERLLLIDFDNQEKVNNMDNLYYDSHDNKEKRLKVKRLRRLQQKHQKYQLQLCEINGQNQDYPLQSDKRKDWGLELEILKEELNQDDDDQILIEKMRKMIDHFNH